MVQRSGDDADRSASNPRRPDPDGADADRPGGDRRPTEVNGLVGGLLELFLLSFAPFAPLFGGVVAGYLESGDAERGIAAGAYAGAFAAVVTVSGLMISAGAVSEFFPALSRRGAVDVLLVFGLLYLVGLAAVGGAIGSYLNRELGDDLGRY